MSSYKIHEWNTYLFPNTENPVPMIFIKEELPNVVELDLSIQNTSSEYDGKPYRGTVLNKKIRGYTVVVLNSKWYGYPDLGEMVISKKAHQFIQSDKMDEEEMDVVDEKEKWFNKWFGGIIIGFFIIILIISSLR
jgi:hypothetical protein